MSPLVSVVIPTYNHAHFLKRSLGSVRAQTYTNWEIVLVDNHSKDDTDEVVRNFADPRIRLYKIHNNGVISASRNLGINQAMGEWVAFLDSDDLWYPDKLQIAIEAILHTPLIDVCSANEIMVIEATGERKLLRFGPYCADFYQRLLLRGNCLSPSASLVRRSFLIDKQILFREVAEFTTAEDYDFWMLLARAGAHFHFIDSAQGEYFIHAGNTSQHISRHQQAIQNVVHNHVFELQDFQKDKPALWNTLKARLLLGSAKTKLVSGSPFAGIADLLTGLRTAPGYTLCYFSSKLAEKGWAILSGHK